MVFFILGSFLGSEFNLFMLFLWLLDWIFLLGFILVINRVFSPLSRDKYREESFIPLDDDSPEEKALFQDCRDLPRRHIGRLDA